MVSLPFPKKWAVISITINKLIMKNKRMATKNFQDVTMSKIGVYIVQQQIDTTAVVMTQEETFRSLFPHKPRFA